MRTAYADILECIQTSVCIRTCTHTCIHTNMQSENNVYWWRVSECVKLWEAVHQVTVVVNSNGERRPKLPTLPNTQTHSSLHNFKLTHSYHTLVNTFIASDEHKSINTQCATVSLSHKHTHTHITIHLTFHSWPRCSWACAQLLLVISSITFYALYFDMTWFLMHFANFNRGAAEYTLGNSAQHIINHWMEFMWVLPATLAVVGSEQIDMICQVWIRFCSILFSPLIHFSLYLHSFLLFYPIPLSLTLFPPAGSLHLPDHHFILPFFLLFIYPLPFLLILLPHPPSLTSLFIHRPPPSPKPPSHLALPCSALLSGPRPVCKMPPLQRWTQLRGKVPRWLAGGQQFHLQIRQGQQRVSSLPCQLHPGVREGWYIKMCFCI